MNVRRGGMGAAGVWALCLSLAGCCSPGPYERPPSSGEPGDTTYLLDLDPADVSLDDLASHAALLDAHYWRWVQVEGVPFPPVRSDPSLDEPDLHASGGDSALFSGVALATWCFKYGVTGAEGDLWRVLEAVRAVHWLTHVSGTPGVIARCAFPLERAAEWRYPEHWVPRIKEGFVHPAPAGVADPLRGGNYPESIYYTRATKDQLTGLLLGLGVAWQRLAPSAVPPAHWPLAEQARALVAETVRDLRAHLLRHDGYIRDEKGENATNADYVGGLLRTQLLAVFRAASAHWPREWANAQSEYINEFVLEDLGDWFAFFNNRFQYFAWNLRYTRALTVWLLEDDAERREEVAEFVEDWLWDETEGHQNAWFAAIQALVDRGGDEAARAEMLDSLRSLSLKPIRGWSSPYAGQHQFPRSLAVFFGCSRNFALPPHLRKPTSFSTWVKAPWDVGDQVTGLDATTGLDFLLPYWMGRFYGLID